MDAITLDILAALDPSSTIRHHVTAASGFYHPADSPLHQQARARFMNKYEMTNFGWHIARQFSKRNLPFPIPMMRRDTWVFRAYLMQLDPWGNFNRYIAEAYHLSKFLRGSSNIGAILKSIMMSVKDEIPEVHMRKVAIRTGINYYTVEAFESLFYNILDRRADTLYIAQDVYPGTRLVELDENYMHNAKFSDLLKRAGYNHQDIDMASYMAGIGDRGYMAKIAASDNREAELAKHIMGNGLLLATSSLMNQRSVGLSRASSLLAAARQAGANTDEPTLAGVSQLFMKEFASAVSFSQQDTVQLMRAEAGEPIDV